MLFFTLWYYTTQGYGGEVRKKLKSKHKGYKIYKFKPNGSAYFYFLCKKEVEGINRKDVILYVIDSTPTEEIELFSFSMPKKAEEKVWIMEQVEKVEFEREK